MQKLKGLLPRLMLYVLAGLLALSVVVANLATSYIIFAPDSWPKPFYLLYRGPEGASTDSGGSLLSPPAAHAAGPEATTEAPTPTPEPTEIPPGSGIMVDTGTKIVNLAEPGGRRYIRVNIVLEFTPVDPEYYDLEGEKKTEYEQTFTGEITARLPVINDSVISLLSSKTFEQVYLADGKEALRQEIMAMINERLPEYQVTSVYFTEFVVQ